MWTNIRFSALLLVLCATPAALAQEAGGLDPLRDRFNAGMARYKDGAYGDAILIWEGIYRQLGPERGYRLAFNLGRAYDHLGDPTRAAEHYESFVREAARRRDAGEALEPVIEQWESTAKESLAALARSRGRIRIATERGAVIALDDGTPFLVPRGYVAYVAPGEHAVTFDPGTTEAERRVLRVAAGELLEVSPPPPKPPPAVSVVRAEDKPSPPFSRNVLFVAAGVTVVSTLVPILLYDRANDVRERYDATDPIRARDDKVRLGADYESARSSAYGSLAIPIALGALTLGLTAYWLLGTKATSLSRF